jgi:Fe-S-cluster containining protein
MPIVPITKNTRWECQRSGMCCNDLVITKQKSLSVEKEGKLVCKNLTENKHCSIYPKRPLICKIAPFVPNQEVLMSQEGVTSPQKAFNLEKMSIHTECPGYGKGKRILKNKKLKKEMENVGQEFAGNVQQGMQSGDFSKLV